MLNQIKKKHVQLNIAKTILNKKTKIPYILSKISENTNINHSKKIFIPRISVEKSLLAVILNIKQAKFPLIYANVFDAKNFVKPISLSTLNFQQNVFDKQKPVQKFRFDSTMVSHRMYQNFNSLNKTLLILRSQN